MIVIEDKSELPIYEQLYRQIRAKILTGEWAAGAKLSSSRQVASELKLSRNTIEEAYQQLKAEGYIVSKPRSGYFVEALNTAFFNQEICVPQTIKHCYQPNSCCYNFRYGKLDYRYAPFKAWKKLMLECFSAEMDGLASYSGHQGEQGLREEIQKYVAEYRGVKCCPEQIIVGAGTLYCLSILSSLLSGDIAMEDPGYNKARQVFKNAGLSVLPITVEQDGINVQELSHSSASAVYVTPSHQFPTGAIMPVAKRLQLIEWAAGKDRLILEDDYSCHLRYNMHPVSSLQGLGCTNVVYFGNFSKPLLPSLRIAFMVLPPQLVEKYYEAYQKYNTTVPFLLQKTLERFLREGFLARHLRKVLLVYKKKHDCLIASLTEAFGSHIKIGGQNAGLFVTVTLYSDLGETELIVRARQQGVMVYPMSEHWARSERYDGKTVMLGYSGLELDEIKRGVLLLRKAWLG